MGRVWSIAGTLTPVSVLDRPDLLAGPVAAAVRALADADLVAVTEIDAELADTAAFCEAYGSPLTASANCVIVAGKRGEVTRYAACVVLATTRADVNGVVRRRLDARKASFAPMDDAVELTGMEYGGITPVGLPADWPVLLSPEVAAAPELVIGSGIRGSKLLVPGAVLAKLPGAEVVEGLARPA
ncbi:YbaK/EbsC family protein [Actinosynnema mirum]|uniref:YbaK/prolyl-tRNA synthetase associated region n=1 Tax=Actinosynnema mirum (strain ATCC 29888 / DSM 43827 / JCM 3225 / NBRC 14064 / NCIMB 13271 / NRRL B-12336 / IMRU 3971 / 101) TaxID=446462 RepID=C6WPL4_ACTMD|nr:YbaK/EbsC family protein [Actinosynnema mirum]ACU40565.1 YbaK/prolyl-tRNA synthetase associated region [Actinosynnema mirum DSM 43827]